MGGYLMENPRLNLNLYLSQEGSMNLSYSPLFALNEKNIIVWLSGAA